MLHRFPRSFFREIAIKIARLNGGETPQEGVMTAIAAVLAVGMYGFLGFAAWKALGLQG